jgi:hypothetical protein
MLTMTHASDAASLAAEDAADLHRMEDDGGPEIDWAAEEPPSVSAGVQLLADVANRAMSCAPLAT